MIKSKLCFKMALSNGTSYFLLKTWLWKWSTLTFSRNYNDCLYRISSISYKFPSVNNRQLHSYSGKQLCRDSSEPHNTRHLHSTSKHPSVKRLRKYGLTAEIPAFQSPETQRIRKFSIVTEDEDDFSYLKLDPYKLVALELKDLGHDIKRCLKQEPSLRSMLQYSFQGKGKKIRPLVALLMSKACNISNNLGDSILEKQKIVASTAEMIHAATLIHYDIIDVSDTRKSQPGLNSIYGPKKSILVADYILSQAFMSLASTRSPKVVACLSSCIGDMAWGELMQLSAEENQKEQLSNYLKKIYFKTASLFAKSCQSVALLGGCKENITEQAFQYGKNLGIALQLVDDISDFSSSERVMGKTTAGDLKLGLSNAPVLFAAQEYPTLYSRFLRRFSEGGDVEKARYFFAKSDGIQQTKLLALQHTNEAIKCLQDFVNSDAKSALIHLAKMLLERKK